MVWGKGILDGEEGKEARRAEALGWERACGPEGGREARATGAE